MLSLAIMGAFSLFNSRGQSPLSSLYLICKNGGISYV